MDTDLLGLHEVADEHPDDPDRQAQVRTDLGDGLELVGAELEDLASLGSVAHSRRDEGLDERLDRQDRTRGAGPTAGQGVRPDHAVEVVLTPTRVRRRRTPLLGHGTQPTWARVAPETGSRDRISPISCGVRVCSVRLTSRAIS